MSNGDSFEARLRAIADQLVQSLSENDIDEVAKRFGVDPERARGVANNLERWLTQDLFAQTQDLFAQASWSVQRPDFTDADAPAQSGPATPFGTGPHPLDLPTAEQGIALSGLDSGRLTVRPGSSVLAATGADPEQSAGGGADLVNELRARDWITPDGTLTLVGRQALLRWCRTAEGTAEQPQK